MRSINLCLYICIVNLMLSIASAQQWYQPDSNMINVEQFTAKVLNDKSTFKFVKYFTPHCVYCRYLKNVIDPMKHQKEWCFKIYDFNCQWYPQHCSQNVRTGSFPYTSIHNEQGTVFDQIPGYYPQPVIRTYFNRIEEKCLEYKKSLKIQVTPTSSLSAEKDTEQVKQNTPDKENKQHDINKKDQQESQKKEKQESEKKQKQESQKKQRQQSQKKQRQDSEKKQKQESEKKQRQQSQKKQRQESEKQQKANEIARKKQQQQKMMSELKQSIKNEIKEQAKKQIKQQIKRQMQQQSNKKIIVQNTIKQPQQSQVKSEKQMQKQELIAKQQHGNTHQQQHQYQNIIKYTFYSIAFIVACYYFYTITQNNGPQVSNPQHKHKINKAAVQAKNNDDFMNHKVGGQGQREKRHIDMEQAEMLAHIPDQQL